MRWRVESFGAGTARWSLAEAIEEAVNLFGCADSIGHGDSSVIIRLYSFPVAKVRARRLREVAGYVSRSVGPSKSVCNVPRSG